jgi:hypothetical protein
MAAPSLLLEGRNARDHGVGREGVECGALLVQLRMPEVPAAPSVGRDVSNVSVSSATLYVPGLAAESGGARVSGGGGVCALSASDPSHDATTSAIATTNIPRRIQCLPLEPEHATGTCSRNQSPQVVQNVTHRQ